MNQAQSYISKVKNVVDTANQALDVLEEVFKLGSRFSDILKVSGKLGAAIPGAGLVLVLVGDVLQDGKHTEILQRFDKLSNEIDQVRDDIKDLKKEITWKITGLKFGTVVDRLELGMQHCFMTGKRSKAAQIRYQERLEEVCANQQYTLALNALLNGVIGGKDFNSSILDELYDTTKGHRGKISALATKLMQLACGGLVVIATYETLVRGKEGAEEVIMPYESRLKKACSKVQSVLDNCVSKFHENMKSDLNGFLDKVGSNEALVTDMSKFMTVKYDWLENFCLVYNDLHGFDQHCFNGDRAESLHRNGKCGIVFYRNKGEPHKFSNRRDEACKIADDACKVVEGAWHANAEEGYKAIMAKLGERRIQWIGCAVITRSPDLKTRGTFSAKIVVSVGGQNATAILLLM